GKRGPEINFDRFRDFGPHGPVLERVAPRLARRAYRRNVRHAIFDDTSLEYDELVSILALAKNASRSSPYTHPPSTRRSCAAMQKRALLSGPPFARGQLRKARFVSSLPSFARMVDFG